MTKMYNLIGPHLSVNLPDFNLTVPVEALLLIDPAVGDHVAVCFSVLCSPIDRASHRGHQNQPNPNPHDENL